DFTFEIGNAGSYPRPNTTRFLIDSEWCIDGVNGICTVIKKGELSVTFKDQEHRDIVLSGNSLMDKVSSPFTPPSPGTGPIIQELEFENRGVKVHWKGFDDTQDEWIKDYKNRISTYLTEHFKQRKGYQDGDIEPKSAFKHFYKQKQLNWSQFVLKSIVTVCEK